MNAIPCSVCSEAGHHARRCPQLAAPLQPGFFAPSGGGQHSHDEDDEKISRTLNSYPLFKMTTFIPQPHESYSHRFLLNHVSQQIPQHRNFHAGTVRRH
jgi:hypothetical protein